MHLTNTKSEYPNQVISAQVHTVPNPKESKPEHKEAKPESGQVGVEAENRISETVGRPIEEVSLVVPGVSKEKGSFPVLPHAQKEDVFVAEKEEESHQRGSYDKPPSSSARAPGKESKLERQHEPAPIYMARESQIVRFLQPMLPVIEETEKGLAETTESDRHRKEAENRPEPVRPQTYPAASDDESRDVSVQEMPGISSRRVPDANALSPSGTSWHNPVAQLKRRLKELESQVADHSSRLEQSDKPRPPARPVVVIKQSTAAPQTPRAYWARSYLGRVHLKIRR